MSFDIQYDKQLLHLELAEDGTPVECLLDLGDGHLINVDSNLLPDWLLDKVKEWQAVQQQQQADELQQLRP